MLQSQDMVGSPMFCLTQEFLSHMLGVRRNTVSVEAHGLQQDGLIRDARGYITILNRDGLARGMCLRVLFGDPRGNRQANGLGLDDPYPRSRRNPVRVLLACPGLKF
jgi:Crp-like helix-turn-helix domain